MLAYDTLLSAGCFGDRPPLSEYDRIPLGGSITGRDDCDICAAIVTQPDRLPTGFDLPSGRVVFFCLTGITADELAFAKTNGSEELVTILRNNNALEVTDPKRRSVV